MRSTITLGKVNLHVADVDFTIDRVQVQTELSSEELVAYAATLLDLIKAAASPPSSTENTTTSVLCGRN